MRNLKIPIKGMKIPDVIKTMGAAFGKKSWEIKKFYKNNLKSSETKKIGAHSGGSLTGKQVKQLLKDTEEESDFYYSETKAREALDKAAEKGIKKNPKDKKRGLMEYSKERTEMSERLERIKSGQSIDSKDNRQGTINSNQSQNNSNNANSRGSGWTADEGQEGGLSNNSKKPKKGAPQEEQPLDLFID